MYVATTALNHILMMAGCERCSDLLRKFLPVSRRCRIAKSISSELYKALLELFDVMSLESITIESSLEISCESFAKDVMRMVDELKSSSDIVQFWHVKYELATNVYAVTQDVLHSDFEIMEESSETDEFVESSEMKISVLMNQEQILMTAVLTKIVQNF